MRQPTALTARARRYLADAAHAFDHAPVEVTLSVLLAIAFSYAVVSDAQPFQAWAELGVVMFLTGAVALTSTLQHALGAWSERTRWLVTAAGAAAAALYGMFALDFSREGDAWRAVVLLGAAVLLIAGAPALGARAGATERFRRVSGRVLIRLLAALIYAAALYAGLALALGAVNTLFELHLSGRIYAHVAGWIFIVLVTWVVVGGVPDYVQPATEAGPVAAAVHRLSAFLVTPLLAIYYLILYSYAVRIALTGELPKNLVSPLVIAAGLIAGIALVLFDRTDEEHVPLRPLRLAAPLFLPLCALALYALGPRVEQYGWTEFRGLRTVLLAALGALAVAATVRVIRRRPLPLHVLPLGLALVAFLSVASPWSVIAAARRSQQGRLQSAMSQAGIAWDARAVRDSIVPNEPYREINETAGYLNRHFGAAALPPLFAAHATRGGPHTDVAWEAGLRPRQAELQSPRGGFAQLAAGSALGRIDAGELHYVRIERRSRAETDSSAVDLARVPVAVAGTTLFADLTSIAAALGTGPQSRPLTGATARVPLLDDAGRERGQLYVLEVGLGGSPLGLNMLNGLARLAPE